MGLIQLVITLLIVGLLLWLIDQAPFIEATMKSIIRWIVIVVVVIWLLSAFVGDINLPRWRR